MAPGSHDEEVLCVVGILGLRRQVTMNGAPHVFLIPESLNPHGRNLQWLPGHRFVERLRLPEHIVGGMLGDFPPPWQLIEACSAREISGGPGAAEVFVIVAGLAYDRAALAFDGRLIGEVIEVDLPERAEMEPVVSHPAIDHWAHG